MTYQHASTDIALDRGAMLTSEDRRERFVFPVEHYVLLTTEVDFVGRIPGIRIFVCPVDGIIKFQPLACGLSNLLTKIAA